MQLTQTAIRIRPNIAASYVFISSECPIGLIKFRITCFSHMRYRNCAELVMNVIPGAKERNIVQLFITPTDAHFKHKTI